MHVFEDQSILGRFSLKLQYLLLDAYLASAQNRFLLSIYANRCPNFDQDSDPQDEGLEDEGVLLPHVMEASQFFP